MFVHVCVHVCLFVCVCVRMLKVCTCVYMCTRSSAPVLAYMTYMQVPTQDRRRYWIFWKWNGFEPSDLCARNWTQVLCKISKNPQLLRQCPANPVPFVKVFFFFFFENLVFQYNIRNIPILLFPEFYSPSTKQQGLANGSPNHRAQSCFQRSLCYTGSALSTWNLGTEASSPAPSTKAPTQNKRATDKILEWP